MGQSHPLDVSQLRPLLYAQTCRPRRSQSGFVVENRSELPKLLAMKVLLAEDDQRLAEFVADGLRSEGIGVDVVGHGDDCMVLLQTRQYDAALLDIMLPGRDGLGIVKLLRERKNTVPVIILSARGELEDRLQGLNVGADDYLAKPFHLEELVARLKSVWRRGSGQGLSVLTVADLQANLMTREVRRGTRKIALTPQEFALLAFFLRSPGRIRTRSEILDHVWDYQFNPGANLVDVTVRRLRAKIDLHGEVPLLETIRGAGYRMRDSRA